MSLDIFALSGQAGSSGRRRREQGLLRMAAANIIAVSGGRVGRVAGIGSGVCCILEVGWPSVVLKSWVLGNQSRLRTHEQRTLTSGCT